MTLGERCRTTSLQRSRLVLWGSWIGAALTVPAWLFGWVDDRALIAITLLLSWATQITTSSVKVHQEK